MNSLFDRCDFTKTMRDYDYTRKAEQDFQKLYESESFDDCDSEEIFQYLYKRMEMVSFGDYLKRYIYEDAKIEEPFANVSDQEYADIIAESFRETMTPVSMQPTTKRIGAAAKSWITASTVKRETVLLLGFGLRMSLGDVSLFLTKVLHEHDFDLQSPVEAVCLHCFWNEKSFRQAKEYFRQYEAITEEECRQAGCSEEAAQQMIRGVQGRIALLGEENFLVEYLRALKSCYFRALSDETGRKVPGGSVLKSGGQILAEQEFSRLYQEACKGAYKVLSESYEDWQDKGRTEADVTSGTLEKMLCSGIPVNGSGNLAKSSVSLLGKAFGGYRMSRQRIDSLLKGKTDVERTDLITLEFFLYAIDDSYTDPAIRFDDFRRETNRILTHCSMYPLHVVNPYETFILLCTLSEYPLAAYNDIWEYSYETE